MTNLADEVGNSRERQQIVQSASRVMTEGIETLDQEARDCARDALSKISSHEALCTERWTQQRAALDVLGGNMTTLQKSLDKMSSLYIPALPGATIAGLMGLCGWLAARAFPIH